MPRAEELRVGGIEPLTTVDFPGRLATVLFCQGCPWRCAYCYNRHLQAFGLGQWNWAAIEEFLGARRGFLDGVVFSGGEPTAQPALPAAMERVAGMGFAVGLHTAGIYPGRLAALLPWLEWVGLDIKAPLDARYDAVTGVLKSYRPVRQALEILLRANVKLQLRTTVDPGLLSVQDLEDLQAELGRLGAPPAVFQEKISPPASPAREGDEGPVGEKGDSERG